MMLLDETMVEHLNLLLNKLRQVSYSYHQMSLAFDYWGHHGISAFTRNEGNERWRLTRKIEKFMLKMNAMPENMEIPAPKKEYKSALAALTDTARTAKVVATKRCVVASLPKDNFVELFRDKPATVFKLVKDMSRTIVDLNRQVAENAQAGGKL